MLMSGLVRRRHQLRPALGRAWGAVPEREGGLPRGRCHTGAVSEWSTRYAESAAVLQMMSEEELTRVGAASYFSTAVTNGLLAVVSAELPGQEAKRGGWTKPAAELLTLLEQSKQIAFSHEIGGIFGEPDERIDWSINVECLREGIEMTDPIRHGRQPVGVLGLRHVEALVALDRHDALGDLSSASYDERLARERYVDSRIAGAAYDLLLILDATEIERRTSREYLSQFEPVSPKDMLIFGGWDECPVCDYETLHIEHGQCVLCGYQRNRAVADEEELMDQISSAIARDRS